MSQLNFFNLFILLGAITQALSLAASAPTLEARASKTCPRGQRVQLSISRGKNPTLYGELLGEPGSGEGSFVDFDVTDVTRAANFTFLNIDGNCRLALYGDNKARSLSYQSIKYPCDDDYPDIRIGEQPDYNPSELESAPVFCNIDTQNHLACSVTLPTCNETQSTLYTITSRYRGLSLGQADNPENFPLAKVDVMILPAT